MSDVEKLVNGAGRRGGGGVGGIQISSAEWELGKNRNIKRGGGGRLFGTPEY